MKEKIEELKEAIKERDSEVVHSVYDDIIYKIANEASPEIVKELDKLVKDIDFWYA